MKVIEGEIIVDNRYVGQLYIPSFLFLLFNIQELHKKIIACNNDVDNIVTV